VADETAVATIEKRITERSRKKFQRKNVPLCLNRVCRPIFYKRNSPIYSFLSQNCVLVVALAQEALPGRQDASALLIALCALHTKQQSYQRSPELPNLTVGSRNQVN
jgi:hypothetical protein